MRLARGSGIDGLTGMSTQVALTFQDDGGSAIPVSIVRPMLWLPKARLVATLRHQGLDWLEDPSNQNAAFERVRWRRLMPLLAAEGLTTDQIGLSIRRLQRAHEAMRHLRDSDYATQGGAVDWHQGAYVSIDWDRLDAPPDVRVRVLAAVLAQFSPSDVPVRLAQIETASTHFERPGADALTLGDCVLEGDGHGRGLVITREPGRNGLPDAPVTAGSKVIWDRRIRDHC